MHFEHTPKVQELREHLLNLMDDPVYPNEARRNAIAKHELAPYKAPVPAR